jgi:periplasmic protein CpxP/Spy
MSEQDQTSNPVTKSGCCHGSSHGRRGKIWLVLLAVAVVSGLVGAMSAKAYQFHHGFGGPMGMMMGGPADPGEAADRAAWMAKALSRHIEATAEQKGKITSIATEAAKDLFPFREKMVASRQQAIELLRKPNVSRDDIERLRAEQLANAEAMSKRLAQAMGDMTEVLTLEQRHELAADISHFSKRWSH